MLRYFLAAVVAFPPFIQPAFAESLSKKIEATGDPRLDGILSNVTWASNELTYAFPDAPFERIPAGTRFSPLGTEQRVMVRSVMNELMAITGLKLNEVQDVDAATLTFARWSSASRLGRVDSTAPTKSGWVPNPGQTWVSPQDEKLTDGSPGSYPRGWWFQHEIAHIFGLEHTHNNFARHPAPFELDNLSHTVMSYRVTPNWIVNFPRGNVFPTTYMPLDIFALQHLYGANWKTNFGDTVYKFSPDSGDFSINGTRQPGNPTGKLFLTLWDGGGTDTLDFSAYGTDGNFDMRPGHFSTPSQAQRVEFKPGEKAEGSIAMPYLPKGDPRALIENIVVGDGNNTITLNYADNHVTLGSGRNRIVEHPGAGKDVIENFGEDDVLDLCGYHVPGKMVHVTVDGADALITVDQWPKDEIRLKGTTTGNPQIRTDCERPVASRVPAGAAKSDPVAPMAELESSSAAEIMTKAEKLWKSGDYEKAAALAWMAYEKNGDSNAAYRLGTAYYGGYGVKKDLEAAWRYLSIPALDNIRYALYYRGLILADPAYSGHDVTAARVALQKASDMGVPEAGNALANLPGG